MTIHRYVVEYAALIGWSLLAFAVSATTLWWMLDNWNGEPDADELGPVSDRQPLSFSLIVPARHEEAVLADTLNRLSFVDYPAFEVVAVVGHDDTATHVVATRAAVDSYDRVRVVVDHNWPKNKPKALNTALAHCTGDIVGIFDAEDEVSLELLRRVNELFQTSRADVVQAGVQLVDLHSRWFSVRNCLEYFFWYRSRMHAHARHGVMPLGGNTVFFRRHLVESVGGWDPECLAEDCDIGIRLSARQCRTAVLYEPRLSTREETPPDLRSLMKQRTRWNQGFLQVLRKPEAGSYPRRSQRLFARYLLAYPFLQALSAIVVPLSVALILFAKLPVKVTLVAFLPLTSTAVTTAVELVALRELCRAFFVRPRLLDYVVVVVTTIPYQLLLSFAAFRAVLRELAGRRAWEKTAHVGSHRSVAAEPAA